MRRFWRRGLALFSRRHPAPTQRLALTIPEAAASLGISETAFRDHLFAGCPKFHAGRAVRVPLRRFEKYVSGLADSEDDTAEGLLQDIKPRE